MENGIVWQPCFTSFPPPIRRRRGPNIVMRAGASPWLWHETFPHPDP